MNFLLCLTIIVICSYGTYSCTDVYMNFEDFKLSGRTMDLGSTSNWTISTWPMSSKSPNWPVKYGSVGITANWLGDDKWKAETFFGDSINTKGLSCSCLALVGTQYEEKSDSKTNIFAGDFCHYASQSYESVLDLESALSTISIYGPDGLAQHFIVRDATGASLIIEVTEGKQQLYLDLNDGQTGFGVTTNEPTFDWHLENIRHYEWKRTLARQAVSTPGNFYPEERLLRTHMMKQGMNDAGLFQTTDDFQTAFALTVQVLNTVSVPMGEQYGTDTGDNSGEGTLPDHSLWVMVRDHLDPSIYWRDALNPTFRRVRLADLDLGETATPTVPRKTLPVNNGPLFVDMTQELA